MRRLFLIKEKWIKVLVFTICILSNILSATSAQARNALHLATKTLDHKNNPTIPSHDSKTKLQQRQLSKGGSFFASADSNADASLDATNVELDIVEEDEVHMQTGMLQNVELGFEGIKMTLKQGKNKKKSDRFILDGSIKGKARPGRMVRIYSILICKVMMFRFCILFLIFSLLFPFMITF